MDTFLFNARAKNKQQPPQAFYCRGTFKVRGN